MGRDAGAARIGRRGGNDAYDLAHHLALDVLLRFRRDRRCRRGRRQPVSVSGPAKRLRPFALSAMVCAPAFTDPHGWYFRRVRPQGRSSPDRAGPQARRRTERSAGPLACRPRQRDRRRHDRERSSRPGGDDLHGRARDHFAGADLDLVSALAAPSGGSETLQRTARGAWWPHAAITPTSPTFVTRGW